MPITALVVAIALGQSPAQNVKSINLSQPTAVAQLDAGKLKGTLKQQLTPINAANLRKAHERLESGRMIGKLVLKGWG